jgi:hypothetical protein
VDALPERGSRGRLEGLAGDGMEAIHAPRP